MGHDVGVVHGLRLPNMGPGRIPELHVGTFSGGVSRGRCVQLTADAATFIQLDKTGVETLIGLLQHALDYDDG